MAACGSSSSCTLPLSPSNSAQTRVYHKHIFLHRPVHGTVLPLATVYKCNSVIINSTKRSLPRAAFTPKGSAPKLHEAIAREESNEFWEGVITQEYRRGFRLGNRLLRPAVVKVSSGSGNRKRWPVPQKSVVQPGATDGTHG
ncbi:unnamed protein product [Cuscuta europaea]|uniref:Uncharacterized protein n=1 Tax=Cuscuta europaea TaxID=41803 RepID=A0A9P0Z5T9_CUSEU|nr:unnamed protein product [Cuscuta europaea]